MKNVMLECFIWVPDDVTDGDIARAFTHNGHSLVAAIQKELVPDAPAETYKFSGVAYDQST